MRLASFIALALASFVGACATAPDASGPPSMERAPADLAQQIAATVDPIIEADLAESGAPGAAFVYVSGGRIVYSRGFGVSDLDTSEPVDPAQTVWPVASITKTVTALAVLQLAERGMVDLDADINLYLHRSPVASQGYGPLTLRQLLTHTGGLDELPGRQFDGQSRPDMAAFLRDHMVRYRAPGVRTAYGTYGIMLAGVVVEDVSGQTYADYVQEHIFAPAAMASARIVEQHGDERGVATPYDLEDSVAQRRDYEWYVSVATSSMAATAEDMGRLLLLHLANGRLANRQILSPASMQLMHTQQASVHPAVPGWSLGMQMDAVNGRTIAEHGGDIGGFSSLFVLLPEEDAGFFIVSHGEGTDLRFRVKEALLNRLFPAEARACARRTGFRRIGVARICRALSH
jgi:CubicO group peptidase (beta-lactamase class C family)